MRRVETCNLEDILRVAPADKWYSATSLAHNYPAACKNLVNFIESHYRVQISVRYLHLVFVWMLPCTNYSSLMFYITIIEIKSQLFGAFLFKNVFKQNSCVFSYLLIQLQKLNLDGFRAKNDFKNKMYSEILLDIFTPINEIRSWALCIKLHVMMFNIYFLYVLTLKKIVYRTKENALYLRLNWQNMYIGSQSQLL